MALSTGTTDYGDISPKVAAWASSMMLERAHQVTILEKFGQALTIPSKSTKVGKWRRYETLDPTPKAIVEGVTPSSSKVNYTDYTATLVQYGDGVTVSDVVTDTHDDPILQQFSDILGQQAGEMMDLMRYGILAGTASNYFINGTALTDLNTAPTSTGGVTFIRKIVKSLKRQNAKKITKIVAAGPNFGTVPVNSAYICLVHPDLEPDLRGLGTGYTPVEQYPQISPFPSELGKFEDVRFLSTTLCQPYANAGAVDNTKVTSSGGTGCDVYPMYFFGDNAFGVVALKGMFAITPTVVNAKPTDSDPWAQRTHIVWKTMQTALILNDLWMGRGLVAATL